MSAKHVFDHAPIGSIVVWSDGSPRPPERHRKKLSAWQTNNSRGRLIQKQDERRIGNVVLSAGFTLHEVDFGSGGVTVIRVHRTFSADSAFQFTVVECPPVGSVRIFDRAGPGRELVHLAMSLPTLRLGSAATRILMRCWRRFRPATWARPKPRGGRHDRCSSRHRNDIDTP